jgi:tryptophanyl-tRNA synthetase
MRILSGVQPSGKLHLGNYFGAIRQFVELQDKGEALYFLADLHALTSVRDPRLLTEFTRDVALDFLALGIDPSARSSSASRTCSGTPSCSGSSRR